MFHSVWPPVSTRLFAIGRYPVTFDEYDAFTKATKRNQPYDASWGRGRRPVINVSWENAKAYAARAGTDSRWSNLFTLFFYTLSSKWMLDVPGHFSYLGV